MTRSASKELSVFDFVDYKKCLKALIEASEKNSRGQKVALSSAMGCQPAYLSRVLSGDADLSFEHIEAATRFFVLNKSQAQFLIAVLGENRAGTMEMKKYWQNQMTLARTEHRKLSGRLHLEDRLDEADILIYYSDWHYSAIHIATTIPALRTVDTLSEYLSIPKSAVRLALEFLLRTKLIEKKDNKFVCTDRSIFLDRDHPMTNVHHTNWKIKSIEAFKRIDSDDIQYTGVVSLSKKDVRHLTNIVIKAIEDIRKTVKDSPAEVLGCYQLGFFEMGKEQ